MIEIYCPPSPFVFKPILLLVNKVGYQPKTIRDNVCMSMLDPLNKKYRKYKLDSHLTDAQTQEAKVRYLNVLEIDRKLMHLARELRPHLSKRRVTFILSPHFNTAKRLFEFFQCLQLQCQISVNIQFTQVDKTPTYSCQASKLTEELYFSDENNRKKHATQLLEAAKDCIHAEDYYSAINLLDALKDIDIENTWLETEVHAYLALCYRSVEDTIQAEFYNNLCLESNSLNQRSRALYMLATLYLRHHPRKYIDIKKGRKYLEAIYPELLKAPDSARIYIDRILYRNGLALALFKEGNVEGAQKLLEQDLDLLNIIDTKHNKFLRSILYYNLFQCFVSKKEFGQAENTFQNLLSIDPKFFAYYEFLAEFYININKLDKAADALIKGIEVDRTYFKFYYLMGKIGYLQKNYAEAIQQFKQAYELNPLDMSSLCYLTTINNLAGRYKDSAQLLEQFDLRYHNDSVGELIFNNKIIALLNKEPGTRIVQELVDKALIIRPTSNLIKRIHQKLQEE